MVKTTLVEDDLIAGWRLLVALHRPKSQAVFRVKAAFWLYYTESEEWRFVIATPLVDEHGPLDTYSRLQNVMKQELLEIQLADLYLQNVAVLGPGEPLVRAVRRVTEGLGKGPLKGVVHLRLTKATLASGLYIEDAYIYSLPPPLEWRHKQLSAAATPDDRPRPQQ